MKSTQPRKPAHYETTLITDISAVIVFETGLPSHVHLSSSPTEIKMNAVRLGYLSYLCKNLNSLCSKQNVGNIIWHATF